MLTPVNLFVIREATRVQQRPRTRRRLFSR
jgi:hypothetical protein